MSALAQRLSRLEDAQATTDGPVVFVSAGENVDQSAIDHAVAVALGGRVPLVVFETAYEGQDHAPVVTFAASMAAGRTAETFHRKSA